MAQKIIPMNLQKTCMNSPKYWQNLTLWNSLELCNAKIKLPKVFWQKRSIVEVWQGSKYAYVVSREHIPQGHPFLLSNLLMHFAARIAYSFLAIAHDLHPKSNDWFVNLLNSWHSLIESHQLKLQNNVWKSLMTLFWCFYC